MPQKKWFSYQEPLRNTGVATTLPGVKLLKTLQQKARQNQTNMKAITQNKNGPMGTEVYQDAFRLFLLPAQQQEDALYQYAIDKKLSQDQYEQLWYIGKALNEYQGQKTKPDVYNEILNSLGVSLTTEEPLTNQWAIEQGVVGKSPLEAQNILQEKTQTQKTQALDDLRADLKAGLLDQLKTAQDYETLYSLYPELEPQEIRTEIERFQSQPPRATFAPAKPSLPETKYAPLGTFPPIMSGLLPASSVPSPTYPQTKLPAIPKIMAPRVSLPSLMPGPRRA